MKKYIAILLILLIPLVAKATVDTLEGQELTSSATIEGVATTDTVEGQVLKVGEPCTVGSDTEPTGEGTHFKGEMVATMYDSSTCSGALVAGYWYNEAPVAKWTKVCVYQDDGDGNWDTDDTLIACTAGWDAPADQWSSGAFASGSISASTNYWLGAVIKDTESDGIYSYSASTPKFWETAYSDGVCDPYDDNGDVSSCTITESPNTRRIFLYITVE